MHLIIGNKRLDSSKVSKTPIRFSKYVNLNGVYYEFTRSSDSYPLELAFMQIPALKNYDLVFIEDSESKYFIGVFMKDPSRKTIFIEKAYFHNQLIRYKGVLKSIAIVNNTDIIENIDTNILDNVDFVAIEKLPELIDPNKKRAIIRKYVYSFFFMIILLSFSRVLINNTYSELELTKQQLVTEKNLFEDIVKKSQNQIIPPIPNEEVKNQQLKQFFIQIDNGEIR